MSYTLTLELGINWLLALFSLFTFVGANIAYDRVIESDTFEDDSYNRLLAVGGSALFLLFVGALAGGVPILTGVLSVVAGPFIIVFGSLFTLGVAVTFAYVVSDAYMSVKQRVIMTKRTLRAYRNAVDTAVEEASTEKNP